MWEKRSWQRLLIFTPVTLELGGKKPLYCGKTANLKLAAKRIVFGKFSELRADLRGP